MKTAILLSVLLGCSDKDVSTSTDSGSDMVADGPTFYADILPIIGENCQQCHNTTSPMGSAFPLETYEQISPYAPVLLKKMRPEGDSVDPFFMPPFNARATEDCEPPHPFRGNYHVDAEELELFAEWIDAGKPEGSPDQVGLFTVPPVISLSGDTYPLSFAGPYSVPPPSTGEYDSFRCFAMQLEDGSVSVPGQVWVDGMEFIPGNSAVAHHMLLYSVPGLTDHMEAGLVQDPATNSWDCDGGVSRADGSYDVNNLNLMWGWVPGGLPLELKEGMGMRMSASTGFVVQMHYNTLSSPDELTDLSTLKIRLMDDAPTREATFELFGVASSGASDEVDDPPFEIPEGASSHKESFTQVRGGGGLRVWGFIPHMHLAGTAISLRINGAEGDRCLVNVPRYDYNWQQMYAYDASWDELPTISAGDALKVECTYDNSESNVMLEKYLGGPVSGGVSLGDGTSDEMCLVGVGLACDGLCE